MQKSLVMACCVTALLAACSDSDKKSKAPSVEADNSSPTTEVEGKSIDFHLDGESTFTSEGKLPLTIVIEELPNDDVIYVTVESDALESGAISITPVKTILYPSNGASTLELMVIDQSLTDNTAVQVNITTSSNQQLHAVHDIKVGQ